MMPGSTTAESGFADMNGPLAYWGPVPAAPRAQSLSPTERAVLRRLRGRLSGAGADALTLTSALESLLNLRTLRDASAT